MVAVILAVKTMKITFNAPFTLVFALAASLLLALALLTGGNFSLFALNGNFDVANWRSYVGLFTYPISHLNMQHLVANFGIILLLGPILERKYGWKKLLTLCIGTSLIIGIVHIIISDGYLIGASGLVFLFIVMASLVDSSGKEIPITFILVAALFLGQEIIGTFKHDNVSQMAHICGGLMGIFYRYVLKV